ncbi:MAG: DeoR/GlpR family DNA-binding transcription regulator [Candidatus Caldatribacterium sp.]|uniref:DeoR/GlpR family DNA-binding transcription regulator n=1 Tax=Candidatus Caldatribacterium sp. TaxID=2282143 RepID=UPI00299A1B10|nr:DeoR/GlpR family DNA-binding transcription regulator [Candidatus Caldatribacterium sp.]MCX7729881.1 DeoR/GlpR family DNA-binding transcription regulator [Candidatus Caldatribacterium sp.]MDW8080944.1 DeoR/GlpR family DNA-binding transcription regulator [Candidatus Calescibacterium sp.]
MRRDERLDYIGRQLALNGVVSIKELAEKLGVSSMTIRRDLRRLAEEGVLKLIPGGAVLRREPNPVNEKEYIVTKAQLQMTKEKIKICKKAASLIRPGDTIIIDTGSTTEHLPGFIPPDMDLTIICYCLNILLNVYKHNKGSRIVFPGGHFHENTLMFESPEGISLIRKMRANKAFVSAAGIDEKLGVTCANFYEVDTKRAIIESSNQRILLVDSTKFGKVTAAYFADLKEFDVVITDTGIPEKYIKVLKEIGTKVYIV